MRRATKSLRATFADRLGLVGRGFVLVGVALAANCGGDRGSSRQMKDEDAARVASDIRRADGKVAELEAESVKLLAQIREMEESNRVDRHALYHNLACIYRQGGRFAEAESAFLEALRLDQAAADTHLGLGLLYDENLRQPGKARGCFVRFLELSPDGPHAADVQARLGRMKKLTEGDGVQK